MSAEHNKALVRRYYEEMWNSWDFALGDELIGDGITFRGSLGVSVQGREGFKEYMRTVRRAFHDFHNHVEELIAEDDKVVARLTYTGTHHGEVFGISPTGRRVIYAGVAIFRVAEGRIAQGWGSGGCSRAGSSARRWWGVITDVISGRVSHATRHAGLGGKTGSARTDDRAPQRRPPKRGRRRAHLAIYACRGAGVGIRYVVQRRACSVGRGAAGAVRRSRLADAQLVGSTSFIEPNLQHRRIEIGATWYSPNAWGSQVNTESKLLLLRHAFEVLGMNRVSFVTDVLNDRSQSAIAKLGVVRQGVCRSHMITQGGRVRDSTLFSGGVAAGETAVGGAVDRQEIRVINEATRRRDCGVRGSVSAVLGSRLRAAHRLEPDGKGCA